MYGGVLIDDGENSCLSNGLPPKGLHHGHGLCKGKLLRSAE